MAKPIGTLGTIPTLTVGGWVFTDLDNLIQLCASNSNQKYWRFVAPNGTGAYQVTTGKTYKIYAAQITAATDIDSLSGLLYGDNSVDNSNTPPTNAVFQYDTSVNVGGIATYVVPKGVTGFVTRFDVPALKYPHLLGSQTPGLQSGVTIFGYEV